MTEVINISQLKPACTPAEAVPAQQLKRGCPKKQTSMIPPKRGSPSSSAQPGRSGRHPSSTMKGHSETPAPQSPPVLSARRHLRSGRSYALEPLVPSWRGGNCGRPAETTFIPLQPPGCFQFAESRYPVGSEDWTEQDLSLSFSETDSPFDTQLVCNPNVPYPLQYIE